MADGLADLNDLLQRAFRYALSLTRDRNRAEDLVQDACLALSRGGGPWRIGYMIAVIRNRHIDLGRRHQAITFHSLGERDIASVPDGLREPIDPDLDSALASLRPDERELLFLSAVEAYSASEIAELTGRPRGTVLSAIYRAKGKLRALLSSVAQAEIS